MTARPDVAADLTGHESTGTLTIGHLTRTLPEAEARTLFLAAGAIAARRPTGLVIDQDTCVVVTATTHIALTIEQGFADAYDPDAALDRATQPRGR